MSTNVFISHLPKDTAYAKRLGGVLEGEGLSCCYSDGSTDNFHEINLCDVFVVVHSKDANSSRRMANEVTAAVNSRRSVVALKVDSSLLEGSMEYNLADVPVHFIASKKNVDVIMETMRLTVLGRIPSLADRYQREVDELVKRNGIARRHNSALRRLTLILQIVFMILSSLSVFLCAYLSDGSWLSGLIMAVAIHIVFEDAVSVILPQIAFAVSRRMWRGTLFNVSRFLLIPFFLFLIAGILIIFFEKQTATDVFLYLSIMFVGVVGIIPYVTFMFVKKVRVDEELFLERVYN